MSALKHSAEKPTGRRKHVEKVSSGEIFISVTEAAKAAGVGITEMSHHLNGRRKHIRGETYRFTGETSAVEYSPSHGNPDLWKIDRRKRVVKLSTGEAFDSVTDAASHAGVGKSTMSRHLNGHCRHIHGETYHFEGQEPKVDMTKPISRLRKRVVKLSTGEVFDSVNDASSHAGVGKSTMSRHLNGYARHANGEIYHFEGQEPKVVTTPFRSSKRKPVINVSTGEVFDSLTEAANHAGVHKTTMSECVNGKINHVRGDLYMFLSA